MLFCPNFLHIRQHSSVILLEQATLKKQLAGFLFSRKDNERLESGDNMPLYLEFEPGQKNSLSGLRWLGKQPKN